MYYSDFSFSRWLVFNPGYVVNSVDDIWIFPPTISKQPLTKKKHENEVNIFKSYYHY